MSVPAPPPAYTEVKTDCLLARYREEFGLHFDPAEDFTDQFFIGQILMSECTMFSRQLIGTSCLSSAVRIAEEKSSADARWDLNRQPNWSAQQPHMSNHWPASMRLMQVGLWVYAEKCLYPIWWFDKLKLPKPWVSPEVPLPGCLNPRYLPTMHCLDECADSRNQPSSESLFWLSKAQADRPVYARKLAGAMDVESAFTRWNTCAAWLILEANERIQQRVREAKPSVDLPAQMTWCANAELHIHRLTKQMEDPADRLRLRQVVFSEYVRKNPPPLPQTIEQVIERVFHEELAVLTVDLRRIQRGILSAIPAEFF